MYSLPLTSHTRPPSPRAMTTSCGTLPKVPAGSTRRAVSTSSRSASLVLRFGMVRGLQGAPKGQGQGYRLVGVELQHEPAGMRKPRSGEGFPAAGSRVGWTQTSALSRDARAPVWGGSHANTVDWLRAGRRAGCARLCAARAGRGHVDHL